MAFAAPLADLEAAHFAQWNAWLTGVQMAMHAPNDDLDEFIDHEDRFWMHPDLLGPEFPEPNEDPRDTACPRGLCQWPPATDQQAFKELADFAIWSGELKSFLWSARGINGYMLAEDYYKFWIHKGLWPEDDDGDTTPEPVFPVWIEYERQRQAIGVPLKTVLYGCAVIFM